MRVRAKASGACRERRFILLAGQDVDLTGAPFNFVPEDCLYSFSVSDENGGYVKGCFSGNGSGGVHNVDNTASTDCFELSSENGVLFLNGLDDFDRTVCVCICKDSPLCEPI